MSKLSDEMKRVSGDGARRKVRAVLKKGGVVYLVTTATATDNGTTELKYAVARVAGALDVDRLGDQQFMNDTCVWLGDSHAEALSVGHGMLRALGPEEPCGLLMDMARDSEGASSEGASLH